LLLLLALAGCSPAGLAGTPSCAECHAEQVQHLDYGPHRELTCEECHGTGERHASGGDPRARMFLGGAEQCVSCHREIESLETHLQTVERLHKVTLDRKKVGGSCAFCHDPHLLE
jgi:hypothetical protein